METGVGRVRAADGSRAILSLFRPELVVSFGIAGAPREGLAIGDVVAARDVRRLQNGRTTPALPLPALSDAVFRAVAESLRPTGARLSWGSVITTDGEQSLEADGSAMENPVLEMETAAVAEACAEARIPLLSLRAISDSVDQPLPFNLADYFDDRHQLLIGRLMGAVIRRPSMLPALLRLGRNAGRAAENAAAATIAALREQLKD